MSHYKNYRVPKAFSEGVEKTQAFETDKEIISTAPSNNDEDDWDYSYDSDQRCYPRPELPLSLNASRKELIINKILWSAMMTPPTTKLEIPIYL